MISITVQDHSRIRGDSDNGAPGYPDFSIVTLRPNQLTFTRVVSYAVSSTKSMECEHHMVARMAADGSIDVHVNEVHREYAEELDPKKWNVEFYVDTDGATLKIRYVSDEHASWSSSVCALVFY